MQPSSLERDARHLDRSTRVSLLAPAGGVIAAVQVYSRNKRARSDHHARRACSRAARFGQRAFRAFVSLLSGLALLFSGGGFALWGYLGLGVGASQGQHEGLIAAGAYRYSRNPQYVGTIVSLLGYAVLFNSALELIVWVLWSAWFLAAPFAEESWLREQVGPSYDEYAKEVPRYFRWVGLSANVRSN